MALEGGEGGEGWDLDAGGWGQVECEPMISDGHLPYPWGWHWRNGEWGVGCSGEKCLREGRG